MVGKSQNTNSTVSKMRTDNVRMILDTNAQYETIKTLQYATNDKENEINLTIVWPITQCKVVDSLAEIYKTTKPHIDSSNATKPHIYSYNATKPVTPYTSKTSKGVTNAQTLKPSLKDLSKNPCRGTPINQDGTLSCRCLLRVIGPKPPSLPPSTDTRSESCIPFLKEVITNH